MSYLVRTLLRYIPVLEIGLLWCASLSDTCSEEVTLNKVEKTLVLIQALHCVLVWTHRLDCAVPAAAMLDLVRLKLSSESLCEA